MPRSIRFNDLSLETKARVNALDNRMRVIQYRIKKSKKNTTQALHLLIQQHNRELKAAQIAINDVQRDLYNIITETDTEWFLEDSSDLSEDV